MTLQQLIEKADEQHKHDIEICRKTTEGKEPHLHILVCEDDIGLSTVLLNSPLMLLDDFTADDWEIK